MDATPLREPPPILYHYTNTEGFLGIVGRRTLWASSVHCLNDAVEYRYAFNFLRDFCDRPTSLPYFVIGSIKDALDGEWKGVELQSRFVASFSEVGDDLSQWRAYARPAPGFCMGFDSKALERIAERESLHLVACVYDKDTQAQQVNDLINKVIQESGTETFEAPDELALLANEIIGSMRDLAALFKHPKFAGEREWRLVSESLPSAGPRIHFRAGRSLIVPYVEVPLADAPQGVPLAEVIVGPSPIPVMPHATASDFLATYGCKLSRFAVKPSAVPFRDW